MLTSDFSLKHSNCISRINYLFWHQSPFWIGASFINTFVSHFLFLPEISDSFPVALFHHRMFICKLIRAWSCVLRSSSSHMFILTHQWATMSNYTTEWPVRQMDLLLPLPLPLPVAPMKRVSQPQQCWFLFALCSNLVSGSVFPKI